MRETGAVARSSDPGTSWEAARRVEGIRESQEAVLRVLRSGPKTDEELVEHPDLHMQSPSGIRTRRAELRDQGLVRDSGRRAVGKTGRRMIVWEVAPAFVPSSISPVREGGTEAPLCSCGRGRVGHTSAHEATDTPGVVRLVRPGKTDQYMNVAQAEANAEAAHRTWLREEEQKRLEATPRHDPREHRLTFGGPLPCRTCRGTGGTMAEACLRCGGSGLT